MADRRKVADCLNGLPSGKNRRKAPWRSYRRERLPGGRPVERGSSLAGPLRAAPWLDRGVESSVVGPHAGSDLRGLDRGVGFAMDRTRDRISSGRTEDRTY